MDYNFLKLKYIKSELLELFKFNDEFYGYHDQTWIRMKSGPFFMKYEHTLTQN